MTHRLRALFTRILSNKGQGLPQEQLLSVLLVDLSKISTSLREQKVHLQTKIPSHLYAMSPGKGNAVKRVLQELDFSVISLASSGYVGGTRLEADSNKTTVANYCTYSGVLVITSTLDFPS